MNQCVRDLRLPWSEEDRLLALKKYDILDTEPEEAFESATLLASRLFRAPIAVINFIDRDRQWFKAEIGLGVRETPLDISICVHALLAQDLFVVPDTTKDDRFCHNPLVVGDPRLRFYAGALLKTDEGLPLGTLCVLDYEARPSGISGEEGRLLQSLAESVMRELELRVRSRLLQAALDNVEAGLIVIDGHGRSSITNRRAAVLTGGLPAAAELGDAPEPVVRDLGRAQGRSLQVTSVPLGGGQKLLVAHDRTQVEVAQAAFEKRSSEYTALADALPQKVWIASSEGKTIYCNQRMIDYHGKIGTELKERFSIFHPDDREAAFRLRLDAAKDGRSREMEARTRRHDGVYRWHHVTFAPVRTPFGIEEWIGIALDVHESREAEAQITAQASLLRATLESMDQGLMMVDADGAIKVHNPRLLELLDLPHDLIRPGVTFSDVVRYQEQAGEMINYEADQPPWMRRRYELRRAPNIYERDRPNGATIEVRTVHREDGSAVRTYTDITQRRRAEHKLFNLAWYDQLTGLANRELFQSLLSASLTETSRTQPVAVLLIDLDNFKDVNDTLGHSAGDKLLTEIGKRIAAACPASTTPARLSGDEFAVLLPGVDVAEAEFVAKAILRGLKDAVCLDGQKFEQRASVGIAVAPYNGSTPEDLMVAADMALYAAKRAGRNRWLTFTDDLRVETIKKVATLRTARLAFLEDRIRPFYQPKICLATGHVQGFEALLRWRDENGQLRSPGEVMAAFQDTDLAFDLGQRMLHLVVDDASKWLEAEVDFGSVAINASNVEFTRHDYASRVARMLETYALPKNHFEVEITESVLLGANSEHVKATISTLRGMGIAVALDDFGTGYASLMHLHDLPVDWLKIDRSFVQNAAMSKKADAIIRAMVQLARGVDMGVVAEGVETHTQMAYLCKVGCTLAQGYLIAKPMPAADVPKFCRQQAFYSGSGIEAGARSV
ncbi:bifunctional diguanylate cyclase/phosphodiesterase [Salinarimonas ramus]|uniref:bifunctional diguanylate cyclase/phosphodiesterase n=1 Tax=Salinarimonas ramus TaxID=690164 RepID=UPI00166B2E6A|nr:EAL domain-containing protein [Salinarimonas ramus]